MIWRFSSTSPLTKFWTPANAVSFFENRHFLSHRPPINFIKLVPMQSMILAMCDELCFPKISTYTRHTAAGAACRRTDVAFFRTRRTNKNVKHKISELRSFYTFKVDHFLNIAPMKIYVSIQNFFKIYQKISERRSFYSFKIDHFLNIAQLKIYVSIQKFL